MKVRILYFIAVFFIAYIYSACKTKKTTITENRFKNYALITNKEDTIKAVYIQWASLDRPNFIKQADFLKYDNTDSLINYCFFVDTKDTSIWNFTDREDSLLWTGKPITLYGKFYRTKEFDEIFPYKGWSNEDFKPDANGYYKVFVYRKYVFD